MVHCTSQHIMTQWSDRKLVGALSREPELRAHAQNLLSSMTICTCSMETLCLFSTASKRSGDIFTTVAATSRAAPEVKVMKMSITLGSKVSGEVRKVMSPTVSWNSFLSTEQEGRPMNIMKGTMIDHQFSITLLCWLCWFILSSDTRKATMYILQQVVYTILIKCLNPIYLNFVQHTELYFC